MSKELIEQLAKEHSTRAYGSTVAGDSVWVYTSTQLEAFAKAYAQGIEPKNILDYTGSDFN